jgi:hypothetical protein
MFLREFDGIEVILMVGLIAIMALSIAGPWLILSAIAWFFPVLWLTAHIVGAVVAALAVVFWLIVFFGG